MPTYPQNETYHKELEDIIQFGGSANYINIQNTIDIGFIPNIPTDRIPQIGNASLPGFHHNAHRRHQTPNHRDSSHPNHPHRTSNQPQLLLPLRRRLPFQSIAAPLGLKARMRPNTIPALSDNSVWFEDMQLLLTGICH